MGATQLLTDSAAADRIRMLRTRVVRLAKAGAVPHVALPDGEIRFDADDLDAWVAQHKRPTPTEDQLHGN